VNGYEIKARRHARELVDDLRWQGIAVPAVYAHMADEFQDLVVSGDYAAWVAATQKPAPFGGRPRLGGISVLTQSSRSGGQRATGDAQPARPGRAARRRPILPGPVPAR
jgi:hypothetical protein